MDSLLQTLIKSSHKMMSSYVPVGSEELCVCPIELLKYLFLTQTNFIKYIVSVYIYICLYIIHSFY